MCGRFTLFTPMEDIQATLSAQSPEAAIPHRPRYNISPGDRVAIATQREDGAIALNAALWGMTAPTTEQSRRNTRLIPNARMETITEKPTFREAYRERRCAVPVDGFYEWTKTDGGMGLPVWIHRRDNLPMFLAGIWSPRESVNGPKAKCAVITCPSNAVIERAHHRMPVNLDEEELNTWLNPDADPAELRDITRSKDWPTLELRRVGMQVNDTKNDSPSLMEEFVRAERRPKLAPRAERPRNWKLTRQTA